MNPPKHTPSRAGQYERISKSNSRDLDDLERHALAEQRDYSKSFLPRTVELVTHADGRWRDINVSGRNFDRPGLNRIYEAIEAGEIDAVVVGYLSRFGRNARELLDNVAHLQKLGATLYIGKEGLTIRPDRRDPMTNLMLTVLAAIAEFELDRLTEQFRNSNQRALAAGVSIQIPYGYRRSAGNGTMLERDDDHEQMPGIWTPARVIEFIFERRCQGVGDSEIAGQLNELDIPTPTTLRLLRGHREKPGAVLWLHNTVANIVECHTYRGVIPRGTEFVAVGKKGRRRAVAWEYLPATHEAIIDTDTFEAAQYRRQRRVRTGRVGNSLLGGLVRCGYCSQTMRPSTGGQGKALTYACRGHKAGCQTPASIVRDGFEQYVVTRLLERQHDIDEVEVVDHAELDTAETDEAEAQAELAAFDRYAKASEWGDGFMAARLQRVRARDNATEKAARLRAASVHAEKRSLEEWDEMALDERQAALSALLDAVVVWRRPPGTGLRDYAARVDLIGAGRAPFELSGSGRIVGPRPWPRRD